MELKEFNTLLLDIITEIQPHIQEYLKGNRLVETYYDYPEVTYENDFPRFSTKFYTNCPLKYSSLFLTKKSDFVDIYSLDSIKNFVKRMKNEPYFVNKFLTETIKQNFENAFGELLIFKITLSEIIDRAILNYGFSSPTENEFLQISAPIYNYIFADSYTYDVYVPILFVKFDFENKSFENYSITKINDDIQLARCDALKYVPGVNYALEACATHAFVIHDIQKKNPNRSFFERTVEDEYALPLKEIKAFFSSLIVQNNCVSGFSQIIIVPHDYAPEYTATLPYIKTFRVEEYPNYFKNYYWNSKSFHFVEERFSESILSTAKKISELNSKTSFNRKLDIAINRLRSSYLKTSEEDSFLDLVIGIETLLSDDDKGELTYKLSVRVAVLLSKFADYKPFNPYEIYTAVKKIYAFRSAIVHGKAEKDIEKNKNIILGDRNYETKNVAEFFLQNLISIAFEHTEIFTAPGKIEELLFDGRSS